MIIYKKLTFFLVFCSGDVPCNKIEKEYGYVCACNGTYCDKTSSPKQLPVGKFYFYYTSINNPGFNHDIGHFRNQSVPSYGLKYEVNRTKTFQKIRGFGGAFTDSFGYTVNTLPEDAQESLLRSFFAEDGIEYTTCRVVIGSSDFSLRDYSYVPDYDLSLKSFNLTEDDYIYKINHIKKAISISKRQLKFLGSAWNAPAWMKVNFSAAGYLKSEFRQVWADYHVKFLDFFRAEGIEFWALTTGNEPFTLYLANGMPIVMMFPEEQREWVVNNLGPSLEKHNYTTQIIVCDDMRFYALWWMDSIMRDERAYKYVSGIALHFYMDPFTSPDTLDILHEKYPNHEILYTESSMNFLMNALIKDTNLSKSDNRSIIEHKTKPRLGSWSSGSYYAENIIENLKHWTTTYIDWNLALDEDGGPTLKSGCDASIIVNKTNKEFYKQPLFYVMGHFSKFIHPDSVIIDVNLLNDSKNRDSVENQTISEESASAKQTSNKFFGPLFNENVQFVGALNPDSSTSVIFYNPKSTSVQIEVYDPDRGSAYLILEPYSLSTLLYW